MVEYMFRVNIYIHAHNYKQWIATRLFPCPLRVWIGSECMTNHQIYE